MSAVGAINDRAPAEDEGRAGDRSGGRRRHPINERLHPGIFRGATEVLRRDDHEQVAGQEHPERGQRRANRTSHEVADEGDGDDHRSRRDHGDRDRIEELPLGQPVELSDDAAVRETGRSPARCRIRMRPASAKYRAIVQSVPTLAGPASPVISHVGASASGRGRDRRGVAAP